MGSVDGANGQFRAEEYEDPLSEVMILEGEEMPPQRPDRFEDAMVALAEALTSRSKPPTAWTSWLPAVVTCGALLVTGVRWSSVTEGDLRKELALQQAKVEQLLAEKTRLDTEIGVLRTYNDNIRVQFAQRGWSIDPRSAEITAVRRK